MKYSNIKNIDKKVSNIFFGTATDPFHDGEDCSRLLDGILDLGINALDTARVYGHSEKVIGDWIRKKNNREKLVLLSKCCHPSEDGKMRVGVNEIREDFKESCELLATDYIDIYLLHRDDLNIPVACIVEELNLMHKKHQIGAFGASNWSCERIKEANEYAKENGLIPFTVTSPNLCLAEQVDDMFGWGCVSLSGESKINDRKYYRENDIAVVSYSSIGRGLFSGRLKSDDWENAKDYLDESAFKGYYCDENREKLVRCEELARKKNTSVPVIALAWVLQQRLNCFAVVGTRSVDRMKENLKALDLKLSEAEIVYLQGR